MRLRFRIRTTPASPSGEIVDRVVDVEPAADEVRIGRKAGVEIQLPFSTVSSLHARVFKHGDGWALVDMGSSNGTFVGQARLGSGQPRLLKAGELFRLADVSIGFEGEVDGPNPSERPARTESTATLARRLVNDLFQAVAGAEIARVLVATGPSVGEALALSLPDHPYKVGRAPDCDLVLSDDDVSREHAVFERRWQGVFVRDLGSRNGIEIDGKKVRGEQRVHDGQVITLGVSQLRIDDPEERYLQQMEADAREAPKKTAPAAAVAELAPDATLAYEPPSPPPVAVTLDGSAGSSLGSALGFAARTEAAGRADDGENRDDEAEVRASARGPIKASRVLPLFVTMFSLAVLGGVGYLVWFIFFGMGGAGR